LTSLTTQNRNSSDPPAQPILVYELGDCTFNASHGDLYSKSNEHHLHLQKKVSSVFQCLAHAKGDIVTREEIFNQVWPNQITSDDSLNRCISVLRQNLKNFNQQLTIKTHPKIGFQLIYPQENTRTHSRERRNSSRRKSDLADIGERLKEKKILFKIRTTIWSSFIMVMLLFILFSN